MAKNASNELVVKAIDRMGEVDPMAIIIMTAAGTAGLAGISGPLTTIVKGLSAGGLGASEGQPGFLDLISPPVMFYDLLTGNVNPFAAPVPRSADEKKAIMQSIGTAAANVVEAGLLYTFVKNDEVLKAGIDAIKTAVGNAKVPPIVPV